MSQKRKLEEYHDPDYPQPISFGQVACNSEHPNKIAKLNTIPTCLTEEERKEKICAIIRREFQVELKAKEQEIDEIDKRIAQARQLLGKVRYAVVHNYYTKKNLVFSEEEVKQFDIQICKAEPSTEPSVGNVVNNTFDSKKHQPAMHPSLKKILGKRPLDYNEILKVRPTREAAKTATQKFYELRKQPSTKVKIVDMTIPEDPTDLEITDPNATASTTAETKVPRYIAPSKSNRPVEQINSARKRNQSRHLLVVGNTSKYIGHEETESITNVTHKWLVYVTMKTPTPVENIVSKVRYLLHESYKPNDIVEVSSPPFHLSKRGWGEFPIRLQLYFHPHIREKPMQIFHNLVLDKKHTGLQTMGAETVVELWLNTLDSDSECRGQSSETDVEDSMSELNTLHTNNTDIKIDTDDELPLNLLAGSSTEPFKIENANNAFKPIVIKEEIKTENIVTATPVINMGHPIVKSLNPVLANTVFSPNVTTSAKILSVKMPMRNGVPVSHPQQTKILLAANKKFMKCIDKNGKVSLIEVLVDPNNPKIFKMVIPPAMANKTSIPIVARRPATNAPHGSFPTNSNINLVVRNNQKIISISNNKLVANNISAGSHPNIIVRQGSVLNQVGGAAILSRANVVQGPNTATQVKSTAPTILRLQSSLVNSSATNSTALNTMVVNTNRSPLVSSTSLTNSSQLKMVPCSKAPLMKNDHVFILNSSAPKPVQRQQSLLKPQVSLLKSANTRDLEKTNQPLTVLFDKPNVKIVTVKDSTGLENKQINVLFSSEEKLKLSKIGGKHMFISNKITKNGEINAINKKPVAYLVKRRQYASELEEKFLRVTGFVNMRGAITWLLQRVPLITPLALKHRYQESFPFVVESEQKYLGLLIGKRRSNEWFRAKYVGRLLKRHPSFKDHKSSWTTKQILQYARRFGFTLPENTRTGKEPSKPSDLKQMIQTEINREHLLNDTISFNHAVNVWIAKSEDGLQINDDKKRKLAVDDDEIIIVDDEGTETKNIKSTIESNFDVGNNKVWLPIPDQMANECLYVNDVCRSMQIKLNPEEIVDGVVHRSTEIVLITALKSFLEDLLRRAHGSRSTASEVNGDEINVNVEDIKRAIISTRQFDFITNKNMGVS